MDTNALPERVKRLNQELQKVINEKVEMFKMETGLQVRDITVDIGFSDLGKMDNLIVREVETSLLLFDIKM